jgi:hypothetical protein
MRKENYIVAAWITFCIVASGIIGFLAMVLVSVYLYEHLTHSGDRDLVDRTLAQVHSGTVRAIVWCAVTTITISVTQCFVTWKIWRSLKCRKPILTGAGIATLSWFLMFIPAAVHAYQFYVRLT